MPGSPLIAFGFGNLAMLGWLAAAAAPILIHLWSRRRFRETQWAAITFLLAAMRHSARRIQLQQWLLLAVRTLLIVLVVLAVAEPYGTGSLAGGPAGAPAHKVLVIDGSYSMAYRGGDASQFARAKQLAADLVRESGPADTFTLILMAQPAQKILGRDVVDRAAITAQIDSLTQTHTGADLLTTLSLIEESLDDKTKREKIGDRHEVYFFTDLQQATWGATGSHSEQGNESNAALRNQLASLAKRASLVMVDVAPAAEPNLAVTQLTVPDPFVTTGSEATIAATLHQFGSQPRTDCLVELAVDGIPVSEQTLDVPAGGDASVRYSHRFRSPGEHTIAVRAAGDPLEIDNTRWLVVPVRDAVRVLCVAGKPGAAKYLADALDPDPTDNSPLRPIVASESDLPELQLSDFDCVYLCNVAQLTTGEAERLARYAATGGGVAVFLGDRVQAASYNAAAAALLPAQIGELIVDQQFGLDPLDYRHPIVAPFRGRERAGLLTTPVARHYRLAPIAERNGAEVAATLPNGDPFLITARLGRGRTVLFATDCSLTSVDAATGEPWTAWPTWPSFLPLIRETLAYAVGGQHDAQQQLVGTPLASRGDRSMGVVHDANSLQITRPDGRTDNVGVESGDNNAQWSYDATDLSGVYTVRGAGRAEPELFAVNVDTSESDLTKANPQQLPPEIVIRQAPQAADTLATDELLPRAGWQRGLVTAALVLLFVESLLAWYFGRGIT